MARDVGSVWALAAFVALLLLLAARLRSLAACAAALLFALIAIAALGLPKVHDGSTSVFLSQARAYIGLPLGLAFLMYVVGTRWRSVDSTARVAPLAFALVATSAFGLRAWYLERSAARIAANESEYVPRFRVADMERECDAVAQAARTTGATLAVWNHDRAYAYACGALLYGHVQTHFPYYERRTWVLQSESRSPRTALLFRGRDANACEQFSRDGLTCNMVDRQKDIARVTFPSQPAIDVLRKAGITIRNF